MFARAAAAILTGLAALSWVAHAGAAIVPSTSDLWDISQGSVVTATSGADAPLSDIRDMFGGTFSEVEPGDTLFADNQPAGFVHYVEWKTTNPVTIASFNLFAAGDGADVSYQREFAQFVLKAKSSPLATNFDLTLYTLVVTNHPYNFVDPANQCLVSTSIGPVTAQYFRAEFTQYTVGRGFDGPRIVELDGFGEIPATVTGNPTNETVTAGQNASFSVTANGTLPLSYQWYENSTNIPAADNPTATTATLVLTNVQVGQSGNTYYVAVSNVYGGTNSASALLTVNPPPPVILPSTIDLWDISQGSVVTATSGSDEPYSDIRDMFGGFFSEAEPGDTLFADGMPAGFVHYVEWKTPGPVSVSSFNLFAAGDDASVGYQREFAQFVLKAKSTPLATNFDLTLYTLVVTNHPYTFVDAAHDCLVSANITPVTAQFFRAEFTQYTVGRGFDGPRVIELDGFGDNPPVVVSGPTNAVTFAGGETTFSVVATGSGPLAYQWYENMTNIPASVNPTATNAILVLTNVSEGQSGNVYSVVITNSLGSTNSAGATLTVLSPGSCYEPPAGIVGWWPGENSGIDISGTNNGTLIGHVAFAPGEVGEAFQFNGTLAGIHVPPSASLNVGTNGGFTIEGWIKPASLTVNEPLAVWNNGTDNLGVHLQLNQPPVWGGNGPGSIFSTISDTSDAPHNIASPANVLSTNNWNHVALTYDQASGTAALYVNGVAVTVENLGVFTPQTSYDFYLGFSPQDPSFALYYYTGLMDEMSLYNRALTSGEIQNIYLAGSAGKCKGPIIAGAPQSTIGYFGSNVVLSVTAAGTIPLTYQWDYNGVAISGATNSTLVLSDLQFTNAGAYTVQISNPYGMVTSAPANLSVDPSGVSIALYAGVTIVGVPGLTYGVQYTTNLANSNSWVGVTNVTLTGSSQIWYDSQPAAQPVRYYRVLLGPISIP